MPPKPCMLSLGELGPWCTCPSLVPVRWAGPLCGRQELQAPWCSSVSSGVKSGPSTPTPTPTHTYTQHTTSSSNFHSSDGRRDMFLPLTPNLSLLCPPPMEGLAIAHGGAELSLAQGAQWPCLRAVPPSEWSSASGLSPCPSTPRTCHWPCGHMRGR